MDGVERKLAAILSADVVGYSRLMAEDEAATIHTLTDYREGIGMLVRQHRGRVVDSPGDNLLAEFPSALEAASCAVEVQRVVTARNTALAPDRRMEFRIGVHLGDVAVEGERIYGSGVNIAARLEGLAEPGGICISATVHDQVESKLDLLCEDLGEQELKNIPHPVRVYRVEIPPESTPRAPGVEERSRRWVPLGVGILLAAMVVVAIWWRFSSAPPRAPLPTAIAVLPFADMSPGGDQEYFADGMSEELINRLSKIEELRVVARTSAFAFKGKNLTIREIGEQLDVGAVVEGSVRKAGDRLRITAQLIQVADGYHLWSETYDRQLDDVFAIQDEVSWAIADALQAHLDSPQASKPSTADVRAYDLYLMGRFFWNQRTEEGLLKSIDYFELAIERDPGYAAAYAGLADAYLMLSNYGFARWNETEAKAMAAVTRALEIDDGLAEAHASLGLLLKLRWSWVEAERELQRALELDPGYATGHHSYATLLNTTGRVGQSIEEIQRALVLDPLSPAILYDAAVTFLCAEDYESAVRQARRATELNQARASGHWLLSYAYQLSGNEPQAVEVLLRLILPPQAKEMVRSAFQAAGSRGAVRTLLELEIGRTQKDCTNDPLLAAEGLAFLGEKDQMFECLYRVQDRWASSPFLTNPLWDDYRSDPRFTAILEEMGLGD
jgi:TolB-like protein/class 3 adenylate cyclase/Tfp pilus assembly protein PilF